MKGKKKNRWIRHIKYTFIMHAGRQQNKVMCFEDKIFFPQFLFVQLIQFPPLN